MRSLKINFGGPNQVSIDWNGEVKNLGAVAQRAAVSVMTQAGSDKFLPGRGTDVAISLFSYGVFDLLGMQHTLNFGALKARRDMQAYEAQTREPEDRVSTIRTTLLGVKDNVAQVGITVSNQANQTTNQITEIK